MPSPTDVLARILRSDATRPRLTFYDDGPGPSHGERIELSAKVLANWVSKAGNALQEELDAGPGATVALDLPVHWRAAYWALAAWSVGATIVVAPGVPRWPVEELAGVDLVVTDDPAAAERASRAVLVTLPMLARSNGATPPGAMDEARELPTYGDLFDPWQEPAPDDAALRVGGALTAYRDVVVAQPSWGTRPRVSVRGSLAQVLMDCLSAWSLDGSVVLVRDPVGDQSARLFAEGVTLEL